MTESLGYLEIEALAEQYTESPKDGVWAFPDVVDFIIFIQREVRSVSVDDLTGVVKELIDTHPSINTILRQHNMKGGLT